MGLRSQLLTITTWLVALGSMALIASGCGDTNAAAGKSGADVGPPKHGGTVILGMDQEPPCIAIKLVCGGMTAAVMMATPLWDAFIIVDDKGVRQTQMATEIPTVENGQVEIAGGKMRVEFGIKDEAHWSDGKPVVCEDMEFTWQTLMNPKWQVGGKLGWEKIDHFDCSNPKKVIIFFQEPYSPYLQLLESAPLPKHDVEGKDYNTYHNDQAPVTSGPFILDHWSRSVEYVLKRNPNYWNKGKENLPYLDELKYTFIKDTNTMKIQLRTGEADWINPPPDTNTLEELKSYPRSTFQSVKGGYWENFAFNTSVAPTNDINVRKAIAHSVDRKTLTDVVLRGQTVPMQSTLIPSAKDYYIPAWEQYDYSPEKAKALLEKAGYKKSGQYYEKNGKPLAITFKTTAGNALREKVAQLLQQNFKAIGIKLEISTELASVFFSQTLPSGKFETAEWAWSSGVDPSQQSLFSCTQIPTKKNQFMGNNNYRYCNKTVTKLLEYADSEPDVDKRAAATKQVQKLMAEDVPLLPMYQRPDTVAYSNRLQGIKNNPLGGQLWNTADWWVTQ